MLYKTKKLTPKTSGGLAKFVIKKGRYKKKSNTTKEVFKYFIAVYHAK